MIRTPDELVARGFAPAAALPALNTVAERYAIAIPPHVAALIGDPDDAIGRQFVPHPDELRQAAHETPDPTGDARFSPVDGVVRRYPDRALLKPVLACPLYCRFCFRRAHVGPDGGLLSPDALERAYAYLAGEPALREVILTGGDPLILSPRRLGAIVQRLSAMPQIETIRVHTRLPIADPDRVDAALIAALATERGMRVVIHANAAAELTPAVGLAVRRLLGAGIPVLAQSVLLRGVNDTTARLEALLRALLRIRVVPTYLHQLDPAPGTQHFHVPIEEGRALLASLRGRIPGDAWPTYVLDIVGGHGKVPIGPGYLEGDQVRDPWGGTHALAAAPAVAAPAPVTAPPAAPLLAADGGGGVETRPLLSPSADPS